MSAYLVSPETIQAIVTFAHNDNLSSDYKTVESCQQLTNMLINQNVESVNYAYRHRPEYQAEPYELIFDLRYNRKFKPIEIVKLIDCLDYQCCETEDYEGSIIQKILNTLKDHAIEQIEGYKESAWGL